MTNKINNLIKSSQEIIEHTHLLLHTASNEEEKKNILETAAKKINALFESNRLTHCTFRKDLSLQEQALEYVKNHPILKPFFSQLFPRIEFPNCTHIFAKCDTGYGHYLAMRGEFPLNWQKGVPMQSLAANLWEYRTDADIEPFEYKIVFDDQETGWEERAENRHSQKERVILPDFTRFGKKEPPKSEEEAQFLNTIYAAQAEFEKIKANYQKKGKNWEEAIFELKERMIPLFEKDSHSCREPSLQGNKNSPLDYPIYLAPFVAQLASIALDQQLKEVENELLKNVYDVNVGLINDRLKSAVVFSGEIPGAFSLLFYKIANIAQCNDNEKTMVLVKSLAKTIASCSDRQQIVDILKAQNSSFSQHLLFEVVKMAATQNGWLVSTDIQNYGLTDQNHLFEIAKIAVDQYGAGISQFIQNYGLTDQNHLFEITKIMAAQNALLTSLHIQNCGLTDQHYLFEIAKIIASYNANAIPQYIQHCGLTDQHFFEIIKIMAAQDSMEIPQHIQNDDLSDRKKTLKKISELATLEKYAIQFSPEVPSDSENNYFVARLQMPPSSYQLCEFSYRACLLPRQSTSILTGQLYSKSLPPHASEELKKNLAAAKRIIKYTQCCVPFSSNYFQRSKIFQFNVDDRHAETQTTIEKATTYVKQKVNSSKPLKYNAMKIMKYKVGNCELMVRVGLNYAKEKEQCLVEMFEFLDNGDHAFLVVGRRPQSQPSNYKDWGLYTVIGDLWTGACYPASEIEHYLMSYVGRMVTSTIPQTIVEHFNPTEHVLAKREFDCDE